MAAKPLPDRLRADNRQLREALRRTIAESRRLHAEARETKHAARDACQRANSLRNECEAQRATNVSPPAKVSSGRD
jgi:hypothetical protein